MEEKEENNGKRLDEALQDFIAKNKLQKGLDKVGVKEAWKSELGAPIVKYTDDIKLRNDTLYVRISSSVLREELSYGKEKIINLLNEKLGKELIKKLVLR